MSFKNYTPGIAGVKNAFGRGRSTNIIAMTGQDLYFILEGHLSLIEALRLKARKAAETGQVLVSVYDFLAEERFSLLPIDLAGRSVARGLRRFAGIARLSVGARRSCHYRRGALAVGTRTTKVRQVK